MSAVPDLPEEARELSDTLPNGRYISNGDPKNVPTAFQLNDTPIENFRPLKVIVIGAGYSGIYCGIRIPERLRNVELVIYEKNAGVGGTWYENRYPGCACDIPAHSYQFSFEPNLDWSSLYAPAPEIQAYLERVTKKYSADRFIKLSHQVTGCRWEEKTGKWHVSVKNLNTGEEIQDTADVLVSARGGLNNYAWPEIDGFDTFKGEVMHSAKWNEDYNFTNKRIGVIGSGSSAIQIVPSLQRLPGTKLTTFVRSKTWISPPFSHHLWSEYGLSATSIPDELKAKFHGDPEFYEKFRLAVEEDGNGIHAVTIKGTEMQKGAMAMFEKHMKERLAPAPHIFKALLPSFSPGCRRLTPGPGYLEALTQPNVDFVTAPIIRISESMVHTDDGKVHEIDALVCATGFHTASAPPFCVTGRHGLTIEKKWEKRATSYLSHSTSDFPNHFMMLGPNSAIGSGSLTMMIESLGDYIIRCVRKIQKENIKSMVVKKEREEDFIEYSDAYFQKTVFSDECQSWYRNKKKEGGNEVVGLWPGSTLHCIEVMRSNRWEDFDYVYFGEDDNSGSEEDGAADTTAEALQLTNGNGIGKKPKKRRHNRMAWLGNGYSTNELEKHDLAWYLYPEFLDKPVAPLPEEKTTYQKRAFSY
ncbi:FAD/NAD(P)-binding domain-containing protein [Delitschia confertaspora ATCC 74209]|uniref:L-ornithine N(5)-monooxygenase [NAD(P)H] n=1 Tax=Delitschia confertaspora ATCC 74209 TaxID=1513339 RepID=A0A9P4JEI6_9PLEO|nr:FAD/NAD(P)-binding domain-containing protein [Delitschia confertaspora ATCC 74209]